MRDPEFQKSYDLEAQSQFRIELPDAQSLFKSLRQEFQIGPASFLPIFNIGHHRSEKGLFSQIDVMAKIVNGGPRGSYSIFADLEYLNPNDQSWPIDQVNHLRNLLLESYPSVTHLQASGVHYLFTRDPNAGLLYSLDVGAENDKAAWSRQVEASHRMLQDTDNPVFELIKESAEESLDQLIKTGQAQMMNSMIMIKPIDSDLLRIQDFTRNILGWTIFIEKAVKSMAKVKGIPQSGILDILPPSKIPQEL